ncbi:uncharacterized protein LOC117815385 [Notolabrus celidotus]|uniref:uncharacterized protein LOC117815385 n=1 Tax=Notolabrus celidotus TaxID=1203425 RepID=UPI00148F8862|nr:uncharacterized protein LOC117815385 [Notolabrus celidotus]
MGRREELSDFQRGTIVGCQMCKKSVRQISDLLSLPRSTVCAVILKWKHGGVTSARPRSGRPHKLKEEDRQVLEKVALRVRVRVRGSCLRSVEAVATEFQSVSGASVSPRTVRRELRVMGFRGRVSTYKKTRGLPHDTVVREIMQWCRGGITPFRPKSDSWLKRREEKLAQIALEKSLSSVEAAATVSTDHETRGEPDKELNPKQKVWEQVQADLHTDPQCVATYKRVAFEVIGKGVCRAQTMSNREIRFSLWSEEGTTGSMMVCCLCEVSLLKFDMPHTVISNRVPKKWKFLQRIPLLWGIFDEM